MVYSDYKAEMLLLKSTAYLHYNGVNIVVKSDTGFISPVKSIYTLSSRLTLAKSFVS